MLTIGKRLRVCHEATEITENRLFCVAPLFIIVLCSQTRCKARIERSVLSYGHGNVSSRLSGCIADSHFYRYGTKATGLPVPAGQGYKARLRRQENDFFSSFAQELGPPPRLLCFNVLMQGRIGGNPNFTPLQWDLAAYQAFTDVRVYLGTLDASFFQGDTSSSVADLN